MFISSVLDVNKFLSTFQCDSEYNFRQCSDPLTNYHQIGLSTLANPGLSGFLSNPDMTSHRLWWSLSVIDTRTVVTRGTGEQRKTLKMTSTQDRHAVPDCRSTYHGSIQTPNSRNVQISVPCPCIIRCSGSTHVKHPHCILSVQ